MPLRFCFFNPRMVSIAHSSFVLILVVECYIMTSFPSLEKHRERDIHGWDRTAVVDICGFRATVAGTEHWCEGSVAWC